MDCLLEYFLLIQRGADINYKNRLGKTALHYTVINGNIQCTRILVERLADLTVKDSDGLTPYQIADREGFADVMLILSQFTTGFLGTLQVIRLLKPYSTIYRIEMLIFVVNS